MTHDVLDASALLAFLNAEPGADRVSGILLDHRAVVLTVNLTEVLTRLLDWKIPLDDAVARLDALDFRTEPYTRARPVARRPRLSGFGAQSGCHRAHRRSSMGHFVHRHQDRGDSLTSEHYHALPRIFYFGGCSPPSDLWERPFD